MTPLHSSHFEVFLEIFHFFEFKLPKPKLDRTYLTHNRSNWTGSHQFVESCLVVGTWATTPARAHGHWQRRPRSTCPTRPHLSVTRSEQPSVDGPSPPSGRGGGGGRVPLQSVQPPPHFLGFLQPFPPSNSPNVLFTIFY